MGSALLNTETTDSTFAEPPATPTRPDAAALRAQVAERLAAHRSRRGGQQSAPAPAPARPSTQRSARIAAAVAERYAHTQSYRAFLAAEAERAVQQARAAAEIAALNAQAVAAAQQSLLHSFDQATFDLHSTEISEATPDNSLDIATREIAADASQPEPDTHIGNLHALPEPPVELNLWPDLDLAADSVILSDARSHTRGAVEEPRRASHRHSPSHRPAAEPHPSNLETGTANPPLTVRLYEDPSNAARINLSPHAPALGHPNRNPAATPVRNDDEARALDEEIAFRQSPVFEEPAGPAMPLPANLIEFPRQLVASRKARPRLAEGPLRDEETHAPGDGQLRIFEVDPAQISATPVDALDLESPATPQWTSIWLDAPSAGNQALAATPNAAETHPADSWADAQPQSDAASIAPRQLCPDAATIGSRLLAAGINTSIILAGLVASAAVFAVVAGHIDPLHPGTLHPLAGQIAAQTGLQLRQLPAGFALAAALLFLIYQALFFTFATATPGMRYARIALCTFDDENPSRASLRRRIFALLVSVSPLGLGFLWAALDENHLAWHDRLSRTYQRKY